ncbi:MAG: tetratricopeptide repeat protein, partial [Myxococcaceae bacterium]
LEPDCPFVLTELADTLFLGGKKEEAKRWYRRVLALCRDDSTWTWQVVERARQQLQLMELESGHLGRVARGPGPDASSLEWNNAGTAASRLGHYGQARRAFERATEIDPENDFAWGNLASTLTVLKRPGEALAAVEETLRLCRDPLRKAQAYVSRGAALFDLGRYAASLEAYDMSLKLLVLPYAWNNRGNSLRKLKRDDEAMQSFVKACALGWPPAHWGRACIWVRRGDLKEAKAAVEAAASLDPSLMRKMRGDDELAPLWKTRKRRRS